MKCSGCSGSTEDNGDMTLDGDVIEKVINFLYLGDVLSYGGVQEAVTARIRSEWKKFENIDSVLYKRVL